MGNRVKISILSAGTWGTALASALANAGHSVTLWTSSKKKAEKMNAERVHPNLKDLAIPSSLKITSQMEETADSEIVIIATPSVGVRDTCEKFRAFARSQVIACAAKGLEVRERAKGLEVRAHAKAPLVGRATAATESYKTMTAATEPDKVTVGADTLLTMSEVINDVLPELSVVALSGPTHAEEVALDIPTLIVAASRDELAARKVQEIFVGTCIRPYTNDDIKGVELCGALKNIIALSCGMAKGLGYGDNTTAAIITRGLAEMNGLGMKMGCRPETFAGLAGMGDLIVTATSTHSRNFNAGFFMGQGCTPQEAIEKVGMVVEGINALPGAIALSEKYGAELPIISSVNSIVNMGVAPKDAVDRLLGRKIGAEVKAGKTEIRAGGNPGKSELATGKLQ